MTGAEKFRKVMREFKNKELVSGGSGDIVTKKDQAIAIAFSEAQKVEPSYGRYKKGGKIYAIGGDVIRRQYRADDYFPMGDDYEFMFDNKGGADRMASDYGVKVIEEGGNYYVPVAKNKMKNGGELEVATKKLVKSLGEVGKKEKETEKKILKALDKDKRIGIEEFKKISGHKNPSRVKPVRVGDMIFCKCLFAPCYQLTKQ